MKKKLYLSLLITCTPVVSISAEDSVTHYNPRMRHFSHQRQITNGQYVKNVTAAKRTDDGITATVTFQNDTVRTDVSITVKDEPIYSKQGDPNTDGDTFYAWRENIVESVPNIWVENQYELLTVDQQSVTTTNLVIIDGMSQKINPSPVFETGPQDSVSSIIKCTLSPTNFSYNYIFENIVLHERIVDLWPARLFRENGKYYTKTKEMVYHRPVIKGLNKFEEEVNFQVTTGEEKYKHEVDECSLPGRNSVFRDGYYNILEHKQDDSNSLIIGEPNTLMRALCVTCEHNYAERFLYVYQDTGIIIETPEVPTVSNGSNFKFGTYNFNLDTNEWDLSSENVENHYHVRFKFKPIVLDPKNYFEATLLSDLTHNKATPVDVPYILLAGEFKKPAANSREALATREYVLYPKVVTLHQIPARTKLSDNIEKLLLMGVTVPDDFMDHLLSRPNLTDITFDNCSITPAKLLEIINKENLTTLSIKGLKSAFTLEMMQALIPLLMRAENPLQFTPVDNYTMAKRLFELERLDLLNMAAPELVLEQTYDAIYTQANNYHTANNKEYAIYCMKRALALAPEDTRASYAHRLNQFYREVNDAVTAYDLALSYKDVSDDARIDYVKSCLMLKALNNPMYDNITPPFIEYHAIAHHNAASLLTPAEVTTMRDWLVENCTDVKYFDDTRYLNEYPYVFNTINALNRTDTDKREYWNYFFKKMELLYMQGNPSRQVLRSIKHIAEDIYYHQKNILPADSERRERARYYSTKAYFDMLIIDKVLYESQANTHYADKLKGYYYGADLLTSSNLQIKGEVHAMVAVVMGRYSNDYFKYTKISHECGNVDGAELYAYALFLNREGSYQEQTANKIPNLKTAYDLLKNRQLKHWGHVVLANLMVSGELTECPRDPAKARLTAIAGINFGSDKFSSNNSELKNECYGVLRQIRAGYPSIVTKEEESYYSTLSSWRSY